MDTGVRLELLVGVDLVQSFQDGGCQGAATSRGGHMTRGIQSKPKRVNFFPLRDALSILYMWRAAEREVYVSRSTERSEKERRE